MPVCIQCQTDKMRIQFIYFEHQGYRYRDTICRMCRALSHRPQTLAEKFVQVTNPGAPDECWLWPGAKISGCQRPPAKAGGR